MFETSESFTPALVSGIRRIIIEPWRRISFAALALIDIAAAVVYLILEFYAATAIFGGFLVIVALVYFLLARKLCSTTLLQLTGVGEYISSFGDDCAMTGFTDEDERVYVSYGEFNRFVDNGELYIIFTHENRMIIVFKNALEAPDREALIALLRDKCPKMKIKLK